MVLSIVGGQRDVLSPRRARALGDLKMVGGREAGHWALDVVGVGKVVRRKAREREMGRSLGSGLWWRWRLRVDIIDQGINGDGSDGMIRQEIERNIEH